MAIFGYTTALSVHTLKTYANLYKVPFISLSPPDGQYIKKTEKIEDTLADENDEEPQQTQSQIQKRSVDSQLNYENNYENLELNSDINVDEEPIEEYQLNMFPDMIPLLVSLIKYNRWKTMYYVYNYDEGSIAIYN